MLMCEHEYVWRGVLMWECVNGVRDSNGEVRVEGTLSFMQWPLDGLEYETIVPIVPLTLDLAHLHWSSLTSPAHQ